MNIYIDLSVTPPAVLSGKPAGTSNPEGVIRSYSLSGSNAATLAFKRHAHVRLYAICDAGTAFTGVPRFVVKQSGNYDRPPAILSEGTVFEDPETGDVGIRFEFYADSGEIDSFLGVDGNFTNDKANAAFMGEIEWTDADGNEVKTATIPVTIYNNIARNGETAVQPGVNASALVLKEMTLAEYQALAEYPENVYYVIKDASDVYASREQLEAVLASVKESAAEVMQDKISAAISAQNAEASAQTAVEAQEIVQTMTDSLTNLRAEGLFVVKSGLTSEAYNNQANGMVGRFCTARELISADSALAADLEARHVAAVVPESLGIFRRSGSATNSARFVRISCWDSSAGTWKVVFRSVNSIVPNSDSAIDGEAHTLWELEFVGGNSHARSLGLDEPVIVSFATSRTAGDRAMTGIDCKAVDGATGTNSVTYIDFANETAPFTTAANYAPALRIGFKFAGTASMNDLTDMLAALEARVAALEGAAAE